MVAENIPVWELVACKRVLFLSPDRQFASCWYRNHFQDVALQNDRLPYAYALFVCE